MLFSFVFRHHVWIWPEESPAVEVDHVVGVFGDPDFGFPGDVRDKGRTVEEGPRVESVAVVLSF